MFYRKTATKNIYHHKPNEITKLVKALQKISYFILHKKLLYSLAKLQTLFKPKIYKFSIVEEIKRKRLQQAFVKIFAHHQKPSIKVSALSSIKKFSITVLNNALSKVYLKNVGIFFKKIQQFKILNIQPKTVIFSTSIQAILKSSKTTNYSLFLVKLRKIRTNQLKIQKLVKSLQSYLNFNKRLAFAKTFHQILRTSYANNYSKNSQLKQTKLQQQKQQQQKINQQKRTLKIEIQSLSKTFQSQQSFYNKTKKQNHQKNYTIQSKTSLNKKLSNDLDKIMWQNDVLRFEIQKAQSYISEKQVSKQQAKNIQNKIKDVFNFLSSQKTKQTFTMNELRIELQKLGINITQQLTSFQKSKPNQIVENINLRNLTILYEKQMGGYGNVTASQVYKRTFQENENLRETLGKALQLFLGDGEKLSQNSNQILGVLQTAKGYVN